MKKHYLTLNMSNFKKINGLLLAFIFTLVGQKTFAQTIHFQDDFTTPNAGWTISDEDGDTYNWQFASLTGAGTALDAQGGVAISSSYDNTAGALTPDNYLISPAINLASAGSTVSFQFKLGSTQTTASGWQEEYVSAYVVTNPSIANISVSTPVYSQALTAGEVMQSISLDISSFAGQSNVYVVFRHHNCTDEFFVALDDVKVQSTVVSTTTDLSILKRYSHNIQTGKDYSIVPNSQRQPLEVGVLLANLGSNAANNKVLNITINDGSTNVYTGTQTFSVAASDSIYVWKTTNYTPAADKNYTITFTIPADDNNTNNTGTNTFKTMANIYAHDYTSTEKIGFDINNEVAIGSIYKIFNNQTLYSLDVEFETGTTPGMPVTINIRNFNDLNTSIGSATYTVLAGNIGNGITTNIPFAFPIDMFAGEEYYVEVRKANNTNRLFIGASSFGNDDYSTICYGPFGFGGMDEYHFSPSYKSPFVRMNFSAGCIDFQSSISTTMAESCLANSGSIQCQSSGSTTLANGYTYSWTGTSSGTSGAGQTANYSIANLATGTYTVTVTNNGCSFTSIPVSIGLNVAPTITTSVLQDISCFGLSNGVVGYDVTGETAGYTFTWNTGSTQQNLTNLPAGTYTLTASNGVCNLMSSVNLTQPGELQLTTTPTQVSTCGGTNGQILINATGGTPSSFTYSWNGTSSGTSASNLGNSFNVTNLVAGTYSITATSGACSSSITTNLTEPQISIITTPTNATTCGGTNGQILISASNGSSSSYLYTWSGNSTGSSGPGFTNTFNIPSLTAGNYIINVTNGSCSNSVVASVGENGAPAININELAGITCSGASTGSIKVTSTANITTYTFTWSNSSTGLQLNNIPAGTYFVTGTNGTCTVTDSYVLTEPNPINITGQTGVSYIDIAVTGGTGSYSFSWSGPNGYNSTSDNISQLPTVGAYTLTVTDQNSCTSSHTFNLTQVGLDEVTGKVNSFKVYPNPSNDVVNFELTSEVKTIVITDLTGKVINTLAVENDKALVNVTTFSTGLYLYNLVNEKGNVIYTNKFSVSK